MAKYNFILSMLPLVSACGAHMTGTREEQRLFSNCRLRHHQTHQEHTMRINELDRINELARKAKTTALSEAEIAERNALRQAYLRQVCGQMNNILSTVTVIDPEGRDVTPMKLRDAQAAGMQTH
jgi:UPF0291 protein OB1671